MQVNKVGAMDNVGYRFVAYIIHAAHITVSFRKTKMCQATILGHD